MIEKIMPEGIGEDADILENKFSSNSSKNFQYLISLKSTDR